MSRQQSLAELLNRHVQKSYYSAGQLSALTQIPKRTIVNWLTNRVAKPQRWHGLVKLAFVLRLNKEETNQLLASAYHQDLDSLYIKSKTNSDKKTTSLLEPWFPLPSFIPPLMKLQRQPFFTGREGEVNWVLEQLDTGRTVSIVGTGGMGKTTLAGEVIWRLSPDNEPPEQYPDGIFFYSFYDNPSALIALEEIARTFGSSVIFSDPSREARQALSHKKPLLILDGAEDADNLLAVLEVCGNAAVLITTRSRADAPDKRLDLHPLPINEAVMLLQKYAPHMPSSIAQKMCNIVGCLPLALKLIGDYLRSHNQDIAEVLTWLESSPLQLLDQGQRRLKSVPILIGNSLIALSSFAHEILALFGALALQPISKRLINLAFDNQDHLIGFHIGELISYGLVICSKDTFQLIHPLIHAYVTQHLNAPSNALKNLATYYSTQFANKQRFNLSADRFHMLALLIALKKYGHNKEALSFCLALDTILDRHGFWGERRSVLDIGKSLVFEEDNGSKMHIELLKRMGQHLVNCGKARDAVSMYEQGLDLARKNQLKNYIGDFLGQLGRVFAELGEVEKAISYYEEARNLAIAISDQKLEGDQLEGMASLMKMTGDFNQAYQLAAQAVDLAKKDPNSLPSLVAPRIASLAGLCHYVGRRHESIGLLQQAIELFREMGDLRNEAASLSQMGFTYRDLGMQTENEKCQKQALKISRLIGFVKGEGYALANLGHICMDANEPEKAAELYQAAYDLFLDIGEWRGQITQLSNLSWSHQEAGKLQDGLKYAQKMLDVAKITGTSGNIGRAHGAIGRVYADLQEYEKAETHMQIALKHADETGDLRIKGHHQYDLGRIWFHLGKVEDSIKFFNEGIALLQETGDMIYAERYSLKLAEIYLSEGQLELAGETANQALNWATQNQNVDRIKQCNHLLEKIKANKSFEHDKKTAQ